MCGASFKPETPSDEVTESAPEPPSPPGFGADAKVYRSGLHEVVAMAAPAIVAMGSATVMQFVDFFMVTKVSKEATAAVSPAGITVFVFISFFGGVLSCTNTFVSQSFAKRKFADCARYTWQGIWIGVMGGSFIVLLWPLAPVLFAALGHGEDVVPLETVYFQWRLLSVPSMAVVMTLSGFFQGISRPRVNMVSAVAANALNVFLNWLLIFGNWGFPELGIAGAAIATSAAAAVHALLLLSVFVFGTPGIRFHSRTEWRWDAGRAAQLFRIGWPAGLNWTLDVACWGVFMAIVVGRLGKLPLAASNIAGQIMHLSFMPTMGLRIATTALVGQYVGRKDYATARARTRATLAMGMGYMAVMGVLFFTFRHTLIAWFRPEPEIVRLGSKALILAAIFQAFDAMCIIFSGALKGAGDTRFPAMMSILYGWLVFLPASLLMTRVIPWGIAGAWGGATLFIIVLGVTLFFRWHRGAWEKIDIFRKTPYEPAQYTEHPAPYEPGEEISGS